MEVKEAPDFPEKVYIPRKPEYPQLPDIWWERESDGSNIEYTRTDTFIKKACEYFAPYIKDNSGGYDRAFVFEDFKKYVEE